MRVDTFFFREGCCGGFEARVKAHFSPHLVTRSEPKAYVSPLPFSHSRPFLTSTRKASFSGTCPTSTLAGPPLFSGLGRSALQ